MKMLISVVKLWAGGQGSVEEPHVWQPSLTDHKHLSQTQFKAQTTYIANVCSYIRTTQRVYIIILF